MLRVNYFKAVWFRRTKGYEIILTVLGVLFLIVLMLFAVWSLILLVQKDDTTQHASLFSKVELATIISSVSGMLLAIALIYQVIQFRISRFQTIFNHQMEMHMELVEKMRYKKAKGNLAIKKLSDKLMKRIEQEKGDEFITTCDIVGHFQELMDKYDYMLTPYFRHLTSVLIFLKYRAPLGESRVYPDYYLNIFSRCELRLFFMYAVWEHSQIAKRRDPLRRSKSETNFPKLLSDIEFDRYYRVAFSKDPSWKQCCQLFGE